MSLISVLLFMASIRRNNAIVNDIDKKGKSQELLEKMSLHWDDDLRWDSIFMQRSLSMFRAEEMLQFSYSPLYPPLYTYSRISPVLSRGQKFDPVEYMITY